LAPTTPIWVDFWIFSDQAQLLDPESAAAASKEPSITQIRSCGVNWGRWRLWARLNVN